MKEKEKGRQIFGLCQSTKKSVKHEGDSDANGGWCTWNGPKRLGRKLGGIENQRKNWDNSNYNIVGNSQDTEKSPGNQRSLVVN